jgi:hypothetical protein
MVPTDMDSIFIIMPMLLGLILIVAAVTINHASAIATNSANSNNMTKYIDPDGRFSIDYTTIWTGIHASNRFQDMLESNQPPYTALIIDVLPTNVSDPAVIANTYKTGFSILQNVECVKYQVDGQKACSYMINLTRPNGGTNLEGEQIFSHVNDKMFMFTMLAKQGDFNSYLPLFRNMLTSFRSPPDTSQPLLQQQPPFTPAACPPGSVQTGANQCIPITPGMLLPYQQPYSNPAACPPGSVQTGANQCTPLSSIVPNVPQGTLLPPIYQPPYYNTMNCPMGSVQTGPAECTPKSNLLPRGPLLQPYQQLPSYQPPLYQQPLPYLFPQYQQPNLPGQCDQTLWNHVYNPARLQIVDQCKTVSGTIDSIRVEPDGDFHIRLRVDPQFASMINSANING